MVEGRFIAGGIGIYLGLKNYFTPSEDPAVVTAIYCISIGLIILYAVLEFIHYRNKNKFQEVKNGK